MNSKNIGNDYEREIAKRLSKWFTGNENELVVWRHVSSGSIGTVRKKKGQSGKNVDGDFQCLDPKYKSFFDVFYMDSKSLSTANFFMINPKNQKSNQLYNEWKKVVNDAEYKMPIMFVKLRKDRSVPDFIILHENIRVKGNDFIGFAFNETQYDCIIMTQENFFIYNNWKEFLSINSKNNFIINNSYN